MEKKNNYKLKKALYSLVVASMLLSTGCNVKNNNSNNNQEEQNIAELNNQDEQNKQEITLCINANNNEELLIALSDLEEDLPTIISDYKVTGLEISLCYNGKGIVNKITKEKPLESVELIKNIALSLPDIKSISIINLALESEDVDWLSSLSNLEYVNLFFNNIEDISFLETLSNLEFLDLSFNTSIEDISSLKNLINLKSLDLTETAITDCSVIKSLPNLNMLDIVYCYNLYYSGRYSSREEIEELINLINNEKRYQIIYNQ